MEQEGAGTYSDYLQRWERLTVRFLGVGYSRMIERKGGLENLFFGGSVITRKELERLIDVEWFDPEHDEAELPDPTGQSAADQELDLNVQMDLFYNCLTGDERFPPEIIWRQFQLNDFGFFALGLGFFLKNNKKYQRIYGYLQDDIQCGYPTLGLAAYLYEPYRPITGSEVLEVATNPVTQALLFGSAQGGTELYDKEIRLSDSVFAFIEGTELAPAREFCQIRAPEDVLGAEAARAVRLQGLFRQLTQAEQVKRHILLCLTGERGSGRGFSAHYLAALGQRDMLEVDTAALLDATRREQEVACREITADCILHGRWLFLRNVPVEEAMQEQSAALVRQLCGRVPVVLLSCEGTGDLFWVPEAAVCRMELEMPDTEISVRYWEILSKGHGIDADLFSLASRYRLFPGAIKAAISCAEVERTDGGGAVSQAALEAAIVQNSVTQLRSYATDVRLVYTWDDLKIPAVQRSVLREAINRVKYRYRVMGEWGFDRKLAYGQGLSVLLYGPPGTGKTMGAQVFAKELGLKLYRIDLSQTMSKYIGETEKNLSDIFERAKHCNAVLFFDEADALFGKRMSTTDAKNKYANLETAYLLQKMEDHDGISILATNLVSSFDDAFRRRITCMVEFPMPDEEIRLELWRSMLPERAPADKIDMEFLAEKFPFSGSMIKNVVISAAYMAASRDKRITMTEVVRAIKQECLKSGAMVWEQDFERYGGLLNQEESDL